MTADPRDAEIAELRRQLSEAEDTLAAIRDGRVDALVVRQADAEAVFSLGGGGESYRSFMEVMETGAAALDDQGRLLYANAALCELLCTTFDDLQTEGLAAFFSGAAAAKVEAALRSGSSGDSVETVLRCGGKDRHVVIAIASLPLAFGDGRALTISDLTDSMEAAAAAENERIGQAVMASASSAVVVCDAAGVITHANLAVRGLFDGNPIGKPFVDAFPLEFGVGAGFLEAADVVAVGIAGNSVRAVEATVAGARKTHDVLLSVSPLRPGQGDASGCVVAMIDMTERKTVEKRQALLMRELDHRVKNTLTLVLSVANRTIAGASDLKDFHGKFTRRIEALAATHNLLAEGSWRQLSVEDVVSNELAPYVAVTGPRVVLRNLDVRVSPDTAIALGLVIHELVTNAVKYGALSNESGTISLMSSRGDGGTLELEWRERGGPRVEVPTKTGFGQTLIARSLGSAGGGTAVEFDPEGLVCRMRIAAQELEAV